MNHPMHDLMRHALEPAMHRKILLRAAELVAMGWTTQAGARDAEGARVRGTSPVAISWCLTAAVFRALFEILGLDGYQDPTAGIVAAVNFWWTLMRPLHRALAARGCREHIVDWNDRWCGGPAEAEALLREAAACVAEIQLLKAPRHGTPTDARDGNTPP